MMKEKGLTQEIEQKFLVQDVNTYNALLNEVQSQNSLNGSGAILKINNIEQAYMVIDPVALAVWRVRITTQSGLPESGKAVWTYKKGTDNPEQRDEEESVMDIDQAKRLINSSSRVIKKTRTVFEYKGNIFELDRFHDELDGLFLLEVEKDSTSKKIVLPLCISASDEVTDKEEYRNDFLAMKVENIKKSKDGLKKHKP